MKYNTMHEKYEKNGARYIIRDHIEAVIKEHNIDRSGFHEYSKTGYKEIIQKFYFNFSDTKNFPVKSEAQLGYNSMHFREELKCEVIDCILRTDDWCEYIKAIKEAAADKGSKLFLILSDGWVYEGIIDEMFDVLNELTHIGDFYVVSP